MLPASNKGVGMNMGFPDVCLTPAGPAAVPIPYPNMAMNAMAVPFCPTILLSCMPALNMGSIMPMTLGDQPGVLGPLFMQLGAYTTGNPKIFLQALPAINLTCPTTGNAMNALGAVLVPSVTNVFFTDAAATGGAREPSARALSGDEVAAFSRELDAPSATATLVDGVAVVTLRRFSADAAARLYAALRGLRPARVDALLLDLRGNPGGELGALVDLAGDFLDDGRVIVTMTDVDGDDTVYRARGAPLHAMPLVVLVDGGTASAAELFAGCLKAHGRAILVGARTYGKGTAQTILAAPAGHAVYGTVARFTLPDGRSLHGVGLEPDLHLAPGCAGAFRAAAAARLTPQLIDACARVVG